MIKGLSAANPVCVVEAEQPSSVDVMKHEGVFDP